LKEMIKIAHSDVGAAVQKEVDAARHVVIGADCWSKKGLTASFLAVSAAFYSTLQNKPFHILLNLFQIAHPHTGEMLGRKLEESMCLWNIDRAKILAVVTDNGANMVKAVRSVQLSQKTEMVDSDDDGEEAESDDEIEQTGETDEELAVSEMMGLPRFPCVAHTLQLVLKEIDKNQGYCSLISKARSMVKSVRVSSVATEKLINKCGKTVIMDCSTRWNSVYLMINRLLEVKSSLNEVLEEMKWDTLLNNEWARLADLSKVLQPFKEHTDIMQRDNLALSNVLPCILELTLHLQDPSLPKTLTGPILHSLRHRFSSCLDPMHSNFDSLSAIACLLDPTVSAVMLRDDMVSLKEAATTRIFEMVRTTTNTLLTT